MFVPIYDDNALRSIRYPYVTVFLIVLNVVVFLLEGGVIPLPAVLSYAVIPKELWAAGMAGGAVLGGGQTVPVPEGATLLTYMFFHGDIFHIAGNMLFLWVFGDNVEDALGHVRFVAFYLLCGIAAGLAHAAMTSDPSLPLIGASGAVAGCIAAYLMLHPYVRVWVLVFRFIPLRITAALALGAWIATQVVMVILPQTTPVSWWAHIGGLVAGALGVMILRRPGVRLFGRPAPVVST